MRVERAKKKKNTPKLSKVVFGAEPSALAREGVVPPDESGGFGSRLEVHISLSLSVPVDVGPFVVLYLMEEKKWGEAGRTETAGDGQADFATTLFLDYHFEEAQPLRAVVFDHVVEGDDLARQRVLGEATFSVGMLAAKNGATVPVKNPSDRFKTTGMITFRSEEVRWSGATIRLQVRAEGLRKRRFSRLRPSPFLAISRRDASSGWRIVYDGEKSARPPCLSASWPVLEVTADTLCGGDMSAKLCFQLYDRRPPRVPRLIGGFVMSVDEVVAMSRAEGVPLVKRRAGGKRKAVEAGTLFFDVAQCTKERSFLDYVSNGCDIALSVAVDFTYSNGHPSLPTSLHYRESPETNEYVCAIRALGDVLANYDSDQRFPFYGFGGIPPKPSSANPSQSRKGGAAASAPEGPAAHGPTASSSSSTWVQLQPLGQQQQQQQQQQPRARSSLPNPVPTASGRPPMPGLSPDTSHCFHVNGNPEDPNVTTVQGLVDAYHKALEEVVLSGPTCFAPVIRRVAAEARVSEETGRACYHILLIISDGRVNDLEDTIAEIVKASALPLSIIICGVGDGDWADMDLLDSDNAVLSHNGQDMVSDVVQFVPFRRYQHKPARLAEATLKEIPRQLLSYFKRKPLERSRGVLAEEAKVEEAVPLEAIRRRGRSMTADARPTLPAADKAPILMF